MALKGIFAARPQSENNGGGIIGTFRTGIVKRGRPVSLETFRVTTDDADVAETIEQLFGGDTLENDSDKESIQVMTESNEARILVHSIDSAFSVWANNALVRTCNGFVQLSGDAAGQPCPCAELDLEGRKAYAKQGGCKPDIRVVFQLADAPDLGKFQFRSGAWTLAESIQTAEAAVDAARTAADEDDAEFVPVAGKLAIEKVTNKAGDKTFTLPRVTVKK